MSGALILIVEDNEANQLLARAVLEMAGYRVDVAGAAPDACPHPRDGPALTALHDGPA